jgi:hypothetical protein
MGNKFGPQSEKPPGWIVFWAVPFAAPFVLFLIEFYLIPVSFLMPLLLVVLLCYLAMQLPPKVVVLWMFAYVAIIIILALVAPETRQISPSFRPLVRAGYVLAGGVTAFLLAAHRLRMKQSNAALFRLIALLPTSVIVSDVSGNVLLMNNECKKLLEGHVNHLADISFFSAFTAREQQGREISKYVRYFEADEEGPFPTVLQTRGERPLMLYATIAIVTVGLGRYAVTVIEKVVEETNGEEVSRRPSTAC